MLDILIVSRTSDATLNRCIASIPNDPRIQVNVFDFSDNYKLTNRPGSTFNNILQHSKRKLVTVIDSNDYYLPNVFDDFFKFLENKRFGLIYASSINRNNNKINPYSSLPLTEENVYGINPMRDPIFYNRKMVDYYQGFDSHIAFPEFDLILKIWEKFPVIHCPTPMISTKIKTQQNTSDLETVIYDSKVRYTKRFYITSPSQYPDSLLEPICLGTS